PRSPGHAALLPARRAGAGHPPDRRRRRRARGRRPLARRRALRAGKRRAGLIRSSPRAGSVPARTPARPPRATIRPDSKEDTMKKILIAADGSTPSLEAIDFGLELAREHEAEVTFIHVAPVLDRSFAEGIGLPAAIPHPIGETDRKPLAEATALAQ